MDESDEILRHRDRIVDKAMRVLMPTTVPPSQAESTGTALALAECLCYLWLVCLGRSGEYELGARAARVLCNSMEGIIHAAELGRSELDNEGSEQGQGGGGG
jgi:hypothetical protein